MTCRCHSSDLYRGLADCPSCGHRSFDRLAASCERRRCGYVCDHSKLDFTGSCFCGEYS